MEPPRIRGYRLQEELGRGSAAVVYGAVIEATGQAVAVKVVRSLRIAGSNLADRAQQEANLCWSLNHPHVVRVLDSGRIAEKLDYLTYLVMERLRGETLAERLADTGRLPSASVLQIARQVALGLVAIHARGAVHRDIKPENLFLCDDGPVVDFVKILDLGVAYLAPDDPGRLVKTETGMVFGTPGFLAPEQARGEPVDTRYDLYGLGSTMFAALVGEPPIVGTTLLEVLRKAARATAPPSLPAHVPADLAHLVQDLLQPDPGMRPASAEQVLARLDQLGARPPLSAPGTVILFGGQTVKWSNLRVPTLSDVTDHRRFRAHLISAIATLFKPGCVPQRLGEQLGAVDALGEQRKRLVQQAIERRREATAVARDLTSRTRALQDVVDSLLGEQQALRDAYVSANAALAGLSEGIAAVDHRYVEIYRLIVDVQASAAARANHLNEPVRFDSLFGQGLRRRLAALGGLQDERARLVEAQSTIHEAIRAARRDMAELAQELLDRRRSILGVEMEQHTRLAALEDEARVAEDAVLHLDRQTEHAYLVLGATLQAELANER